MFLQQPGQPDLRSDRISRLIVVGATGSLGSQVLRQALAAGHQVTALVRTPSKLPAEVLAHVRTRLQSCLPTSDRVTPWRIIALVLRCHLACEARNLVGPANVRRRNRPRVGIDHNGDCVPSLGFFW